MAENGTPASGDKEQATRVAHYGQQQAGKVIATANPTPAVDTAQHQVGQTAQQATQAASNLGGVEGLQQQLAQALHPILLRLELQVAQRQFGLRKIPPTSYDAV